MALAALWVGLYQIRPIRHWVKNIGQTPEQPWPAYQPFTLRQSLMDIRDAAILRGDLESAALTEAALSQEALHRSAALQQAWMTLRHPTTKLFPESAWDSEWNYRNTAADFFCFMLQATLQLHPDDLPAIAETLAAERALTPVDELCHPADAATGQVISVSDAERMFSSSEYVKDGLLGVLERNGPAPAGVPVADRLREVTTAIMNASSHESRAGLVLGTGSEEIGNMLQVCSRLGYVFAGEDPDFASRCSEYSARLAEAVLFEMLPANNGLPALEFDFASGKPIDAEVHLRDHGNEVFPGLAEAYAMAVARRDEPMWADRADRWAGPLADLYEKLMVYGRNEQNLFVNSLNPRTLQPIDVRAVDNWGYLLDGVLLFTEAARRHGVVDEQRLAALENDADEVIEAVSRQYGLDWEGLSVDGYYDAIESALYMMHHRPQSEPILRRWVDDQVALCFDRQRSDGFVRQHYLDGNFIRTALMYADYKSGGFRVEPWREDVAVGFARDGDRAVVVATTRAPYEGQLFIDGPRHRTHMNLPWDWPRLNSFPEWFIPSGEVQITRADGVETTPNLQSLEAGLPISLPANGRVLLEFQVPEADAVNQ